MAKFRNAASYYGNSKAARERQRANLIPGNSWRKQQISLFRCRCFWEFANLGAKQMIYENFENNKNWDHIPERKLKTEKFIDLWWDKLELKPGYDPEVLSKKYIYKRMLSCQDKEMRTEILNFVEKCLKKKLALEIKFKKERRSEL